MGSFDNMDATWHLRVRYYDQTHEVIIFIIIIRSKQRRRRIIPQIRCLKFEYQ